MNESDREAGDESGEGQEQPYPPALAALMKIVDGGDDDLAH